MDGTSVDESAHHLCDCIAAPKALRSPNARKSAPFPNSKPRMKNHVCSLCPQFSSSEIAAWEAEDIAPFGWRSGLPLRSNH